MTTTTTISQPGNTSQWLIMGRTPCRVAYRTFADNLADSGTDTVRAGLAVWCRNHGCLALWDTYRVERDDSHPGRVTGTVWALQPIEGFDPEAY